MIRVILVYCDQIDHVKLQIYLENAFYTAKRARKTHHRVSPSLLSLPAVFSGSYLDHQGRFLPERERPLAFRPLFTRGRQFQLEMPQHIRQDKAHLMVRQIPPDAVSGARAEGPERFSSVIVEQRRRIFLRSREPSFRTETSGTVEVGVGVIGRHVMDSDTCLCDG